MDWLKTQYTNIKSAIAGPAQSAADSGALPGVATSKAPSVLGTAPEAPGTTVTGGKRKRKTRSASVRRGEKRARKSRRASFRA
jgi:hypothetical protein